MFEGSKEFLTELHSL